MTRTSTAAPARGAAAVTTLRSLALRAGRLCLWLSVFSVLSPVLVADEQALPPLRDLYRRYIEGNGGMSNYNSISTVQVFAQMEMDSGASFEMQVYRKRPDKVRFTFMLPGRIMDQGYDGNAGWMRIRPEQGEVVVSEQDDKESEALRQNASLEGIFYRLGGREDWVQSMAFDTVQGHPAIRLELSPEADLPYEVLWLSRENHQELQTQRTLSDGEREQVETIYFSEFKKENGVWFSYLSEYYRDGERYQVIRVSQVRLNVGLFDQFFEKP